MHYKRFQSKWIEWFVSYKCIVCMCVCVRAYACMRSKYIAHWDMRSLLPKCLRFNSHTKYPTIIQSCSIRTKCTSLYPYVNRLCWCGLFTSPSRISISLSLAQYASSYLDLIALISIYLKYSIQNNNERLQSSVHNSNTDSGTHSGTKKMNGVHRVCVCVQYTARNKSYLKCD